MNTLQTMILARDGLRLREAGKSYDEVLAEFRQRGHSKLECVAIAHEMGLSLTDAKLLVHESQVWVDAYRRDQHILGDL